MCPYCGSTDKKTKCINNRPSTKCLTCHREYILVRSNGVEYGVPRREISDTRRRELVERASYIGEIAACVKVDALIRDCY